MWCCQMYIRQNSDVWRSRVEEFNHQRIQHLETKRQTIEERRQRMTNMFMKEQQQAKRLAQKKTEWAIARGQELGEVLQMNQYRERLNAAIKVTDEGVSEAAHRAAL